jgi:hypothetical protein
MVDHSQIPSKKSSSVFTEKAQTVNKALPGLLSAAKCLGGVKEGEFSFFYFPWCGNMQVQILQ